MKPDEERLLAALKRNFAEANNAILKLTAYNKLCEVDFTYRGMSFFVIAMHALYNDMIAHAIRIFDDHKEAGSHWYIVRCSNGIVHKAAKTCNIDIEELRRIVPKLRHIRDKTHFHIDRRAVAEPRKVWADADITGNEFTNALHNAATLLAKIKQEAFGGELDSLIPYDGSDVRQIIETYKAMKK